METLSFKEKNENIKKINEISVLAETIRRDIVEYNGIRVFNGSEFDIDIDLLAKIVKASSLNKTEETPLGIRFIVTFDDSVHSHFEEEDAEEDVEFEDVANSGQFVGYFLLSPNFDGNGLSVRTYFVRNLEKSAVVLDAQVYSPQATI